MTEYNYGGNKNTELSYEDIMDVIDAAGLRCEDCGYIYKDWMPKSWQSCDCE